MPSCRRPKNSPVQGVPSYTWGGGQECEEGTDTRGIQRERDGGHYLEFNSQCNAGSNEQEKIKM